MHNGIGQPLEEIHTPSAFSTNHDVLSNKLQNNNDSNRYHPNQHNHPFALSSQGGKGEGTDAKNLFDEGLSFLRQQNEWLSEWAKRINLLSQLGNANGQVPIIDAIQYSTGFLRRPRQPTNFSNRQNYGGERNGRPVALCTFLCERCLWSIIMPISSDDLLKMKFSIKVDHASCSDEEINKVNSVKAKNIDIPARVKEIRDKLTDDLTEIVRLWIGQGQIHLSAVEVPSKWFGQQFRNNENKYGKDDNSQSAEILISAWQEGNYTDLSHLKNNDWVLQEDKRIVIGKDELREFLSLTNSTFRAFEHLIVEDFGPVYKRYFFIFVTRK